MRIRRGLPAALLAGVVALLPCGSAAQVEKEANDPLSRREMLSLKLLPPEPLLPIEQARDDVSSNVDAGWRQFLAEAPGKWAAYVDRRNGLIASVTGSGMPWLEDSPSANLDVLVGRAVELVRKHGSWLGVEPDDLRLNRERSGQLAPQLWVVDFDVISDGMVIEGARLVFRVNHGRLIELGSENLPFPGSAAPRQRLDRQLALTQLQLNLLANDGPGLRATDTFVDEGSLHLLPVKTETGGSTASGERRGLARVWQFIFKRPGVIGTFRARIDAATGELLELADINDYQQSTGGVYTNSPATGPEVVRPLPFLGLSTGGASNSAGLYPFAGGALSASLQGTFVSIVDNCGTSSLSADGAGNLAFGTSAGTNCTTPGFGGTGNTHAAREQFYQVNRAKELARGWLPANAWINAQLTVNVNLTGTCNAFWDPPTGQLLFYQTFGTCANTGEISGVSIHEFGHGLDANDGGGASPTSGSREAYADLVSFLLLHNSCIGPGFRTTNCTGYGDACTACTGVRDVDWARHTSGVAHTVDNFTRVRCTGSSGNPGPCGRRPGHCESHIATEAIWDFVNRDLPNPGTAAAWAVAERLFFASRPTATEAFACDTTAMPWTSNGCSAGSAWRLFRAFDDDDTDLANGTPHGAALLAAFDRHGIACATDPGAGVTHVGCTPPAVPELTVTGGANQVMLSWTSSGAGMVYDVFRSEAGCNAGFTRIVTGTAMTSFTDTNVADGLTYTYQVVAYPTGNAACAAAPTSCGSANLSGADPSIRPWGFALVPPTPPLWQTPDIWVNNDGDTSRNEVGEPSRGVATNQLFARVTNSGNAPTGGYRVTFSAKPFTTSAVAPAVEVDHVDEPGPLAPGAFHDSSVTWDLSDTYVQMHFPSMFWSADHFCVEVAITPAAAPVDVDTTNNSAQNNFVNIPEGVDGVTEAEFFIYNHLDHAADASLEAQAKTPGWQVRFAGIADPARIPLGPKQWLAVTATATPGADAPRARPGQPIVFDVSQKIEGETVGGLTFVLQAPEAAPAADAGFWLGVRGGVNWPFSSMTDDFDPGFHFEASLERALSPKLRLGLSAAYHSFAEPQPAAELGVTDVSVFARFLNGGAAWRPYTLAGVGAYRVAGSWEPGVKVGGGLEVPVNVRASLVTGLTAYVVEGTKVGDLRWLDAFLGFSVAVP